ncbi:MAG: DUF1002 domain-containing protein [Christensenellaceae bacterium]
MIVLTLMMVIAFMVSPAMAATKDSRVAIGADNTEDQLNSIYGFFNVQRGTVEELVVTNAEEKSYLAGLVPDEKIGNVALSCVYIEAKDNGGIELKTNNINWVTDEMYRSALATAGITDAKVIVAAYKPVSGTGALAGIYKAYESITGKTLDESAKITATEELVVTGQLQELLGDDASKIINDIKGKLPQTKTMTDDEIRQLIRDTASSYNAVLDDAQIEQVLQLVHKFNELNIDPDTFLKLAQAGEGVQGFFTSVGNFFAGIGDFFSNLFGGKK